MFAYYEMAKMTIYILIRDTRGIALVHGDSIAFCFIFFHLVYVVRVWSYMLEITYILYTIALVHPIYTLRNKYPE